MRKIMLFSVAMLAAGLAMAQGGSHISGSVLEGGRPVGRATVSLLRAADSSLVKLAQSDSAGHYEFINMKQGRYLVSVTAVGSAPAFSSAFDAASEVAVPVLSLHPEAKILGNVTITSKKPFVETKLDRTVVNVDASPTSAGATAMDILEKSPGIQVNNDGDISLRGKQGVIVMIDGKPTYLSSADLASMLRNIPASALDQVEIMTNPSSKYDASGNSGIINIKTKKGKNNGFNGNYMLGATTSIYRADGHLYFLPKSQNSFNFNYRRNQVNLFGSYNPNFFRGRSSLLFDSKQIDPQGGVLRGYTSQITRFQVGNFNQSLKLGADWYADKKNVFGAVVSGFLFNGQPKPVTTADLQTPDHQLDKRLVTHTDNDIRFSNFTANLNWRHSYDSTGRELSADLDYVLYSNLSDMSLSTDVYNNAFQFQSSSALRGHLPSHINIYSFKMDYTRPMKNGTIEAGIKSSYVRNDNIVDYQNFDGANWTPDLIRSNHFIYQENINAAYVNVNKQVGKWTLQGGLRVENSNADGNQVASKTTFRRDTTNLFPTAFISYAADKKNTITLSYGRRINRPNYQDLNPFIFFLDTLSYRQGNIYLRPQYTNNLELSHSFMGKYITTLAYNQTDDVISQIIKPKEGTDGKIRFLTPDNVSRLRNMSVSVTVPVKVAPWWNINIFGNVYNNHYIGRYDTLKIDIAYTSFMLNLTNSFTLSKTMTAELSGFYRHRDVDELTIEEPLYQMSIGLQKQVMKGKGTLRLNIRDPFAWQRFEGLNNYGYVYLHFASKPDVRQVSLTFSMRFGKAAQQQQRRHSSSAQEEQSRVGGAG